MKTSLSILLLTIPFYAQAADMYRWVDEQGRTHFSDTVPEKYKHSAKRSDSRQYELTEAERQAAAERARQVKAHPVAKPAAAEQERQTLTLDNPEARKKPVDPNDCNALREQYAESQSCFSTYRNANGSLKGDAFKVCKDVPDPSFKCGAASN